MDREKLQKFKPVLASALWERLEDDLLLPHLQAAREELENGSRHDDQLRGKIGFIKYLLNLKNYAEDE